MGEYGREQRNQLSRAITNSETGGRQLKGFVDNRPYRILPSNILCGFSKKMSIQKKAYDDNLPIKYTACPENAIIIDNPTEPEKQVIDDPYNRYYESENEFRDHVGGNPVPCGLIKNINKWYRIPEMGTVFFVLGECHNVVNYRSIMEESNQRGNALGESGEMPIDEMCLGHSSTDLPSQETVGPMTYFSMESILSKTLFALLVLAEESNSSKSQFTLGALGAIPQKVPLEEDRKTAGNTPFGDYHYLEYKINNTAIVLCNKCKDEIKAYLDKNSDEYTPLFNPVFDLKFNSMLRELLKLLDKVTLITGWNPFFRWEPVIDKCKQCADFELSNANIASQRKPYDWLDGDEKSKEANEVSYNANGNREAFMYSRILEVCKDKSYVMAGMGDEHATHLKEPLQGIVPVITFKEFMSSPYTQSAK